MELRDILALFHHWREERGLNNIPFQGTKQCKLQTDKLVEYFESTSIDEKVYALGDIIVFGINGLSLLKTPEEINEIVMYHSTPLQLFPVGTDECVDYLSSLTQRAYGRLSILGFDPIKVLHEIYKEINSYVGELDEVTGKWEKYKEQPLIFPADFLRCCRKDK